MWSDFNYFWGIHFAIISPEDPLRLTLYIWLFKRRDTPLLRASSQRGTLYVNPNSYISLC